MSTGTSKVDKVIKMPSDLNLDGVLLQNFLGEYPQTPSACMLHMPLCFHTMRVYIPVSLTSTMMTDLTLPPVQKSRSAPVA